VVVDQRATYAVYTSAVKKLACLGVMGLALSSARAQAATAVVSVPEAQAREVPFAGANVSAVLPAGTELEVSDQAPGGWRRVKLSNGTFAFVNDAQLRMMLPGELPIAAVTPASVPPPLLPHAPVRVRAGTRELRLENTTALGFSFGGNAFAHEAPDHGSNTDIFSLAVGIGYFVTDNVELGAAVTYANLKSELTEPGASAFGRGFTMISPSTAAYLGATLSVLELSDGDGGDDTTLLLLGPDGGLEAFVTDTWAVRVGASYRRVWGHATNASIPGVTVSATENLFGVSWGLAAYF
jgi:opacity protein-like surface antigen